MATTNPATTPPQLVKQLFTARTSAQVEKILEQASGVGISGERYLGDRENNAGTVQMASNPYSAIVERITNANDGMLELKAELNHSGEMPGTPREAATRWFGVPKTGINDLTKDEERRALAENVTVMLDESDDKNRPTIVVTDRGIGQRPLDFPDTILSLNRSNKLRKRWLQGAYGQGGSATFRFCDHTIVVGRRFPGLLDGEQDVVGWTVVWEDQGDPYEDALSMYKYLVDSTGEVPVFDPSLLPDPDWHGMQVVHVSYELPKYSQAYTQLTTGVWGMFHSYLFDPVLPFIVGGRRKVDLKATKAKGKESTRVVVGNAARLNSPKGPAGDLEVTYSNSETFDLSKALGRDLGRFRVHYWVVQRDIESESNRDPTASYVEAESAVSMTLYGQRQDAERRAWLKSQVSLPYLQRNLIVQIDVDELSPPAKRDLFASTRERGVEGELRDAIYRETAEILRADDELRRLDRDERERMRAKGASRVADKVREKLRKFVKTFQDEQKRTIADGPGSKKPWPPPQPPRPPAPPRNTDDSHLPNVPSRIFFERDQIRIAQGRRTTVWVDVDAKNGYLRRHEDDLSVTFSGLDGKVVDIARSELLAGKSLWTLKADEDAPLTEGEIEVVLVTPNGLISAKAKIGVTEPPPAPKTKDEKQAPETGPNIEWVTRDEWEKHEFDERSVGRVDIGADATDIWVNRDQRLLARALDNRRLSKLETESREDRYLFAVGCGLYRREYLAQAQVLDDPPDSDSDYVRAEQERLAEAVLIAIDEKLIDLDDD
jgi:hypothetical protein